jgi:hypothetical protein
VKLRRQADQAQDLRDFRANARARFPDHLQAVSNVVVHGAVREQLEVLEDHADVAAQLGHTLARHRADVVPGDKHLAAGGVHLTHQKTDERALAASGRAHEERELAAIDRQRDAVHADVPARIHNRRIAQLDDRCGRQVTG